MRAAWNLAFRAEKALWLVVSVVFWDSTVRTRWSSTVLRGPEAPWLVVGCPCRRACAEAGCVVSERPVAQGRESHLSEILSPEPQQHPYIRWVTATETLETGWQKKRRSCRRPRPPIAAASQTGALARRPSDGAAGTAG